MSCIEWITRHILCILCKLVSTRFIYDAEERFGNLKYKISDVNNTKTRYFAFFLFLDLSKYDQQIKKSQKYFEYYSSTSVVLVI